MKWQEVRVTRGSTYAALAYSVITLIEGLVETEEELWGSRVPAYLLDPYAALRDALEAQRVIVYVPGRERHMESITLAGRSLTLEVSGRGSDLIEVGRLYSAAYRATIALDRDLAVWLAKETTGSGIEYMLVYDDHGSVTLLEGERLRVRIPRVKAVMALHTHPEGHCGLSDKDVASAIDLLTEGGLASGSVTPTCAAVLYRYGMVDEDEYVAVKSGKGIQGRTIRAAVMTL